jgi:uncharacterized damage-inducible protein DinB
MDGTQILETWAINNRINLYLLDSIKPEYLTDQLSSKGRDVANQFAHLHNVRLMWLKVAMPEALAKLSKIEKDTPIDRKLLARSLTDSGDAIAELLGASCETGKVKNFKPHVTAFLGYLLAHDAHHRSQVIIALKQSGHKIDQKIGYGIWEWGSR